MKEKYDVVIIGSGLGGLVSANILARHGYSVCVLEKNNQYGGNLQTFVRERNIFDTGVHYIGALGEGENLNRYFKYLGIMDELKIHKLEEDKFDIITFDNDDVEYHYAQGYEKFEKSLIDKFPKDKEAIVAYTSKLQEICGEFPLYNLEHEVKEYDFKILEIKLSDYINSITDNELLKSVLMGSNFLYAGDETTPLYVHALSVNSYIQSSWRCIDGGSQISKLLIRRIKEHGGEVYKHQEVVDFGFEDNVLTHVVTKKGTVVRGDKFISNIDPKVTLKLLKEKGVKKAYVNRVNKMKNTISGFSLYLVFKPNTFEYLNYNYYHYKTPEMVFTSQKYSKDSWPEGYMVSMSIRKNQGKWAESMSALTYMNFDDVREWENSINTVANESDRGEAYEKFKNEKADIFIEELEKKFPGIKDCIQSKYTSTPLSYRDYIGNSEGTLYGFVKDADNLMSSILSPKTRIPNLLLTGQSLNMHGILGVTISGVLTCSQIIGKNTLLTNILKELEIHEK